jgi:hypothetical protein
MEKRNNSKAAAPYIMKGRNMLIYRHIAKVQHPNEIYIEVFALAKQQE